MSTLQIVKSVEGSKLFHPTGIDPFSILMTLSSLVPCNYFDIRDVVAEVEYYVRGNHPMRLSIAMFAFFSIASAGVAHAATPLACEVDARSLAGGRVWMTKFDPSTKLPVDMPQHVSWQPPSSTGVIKMAVGGKGGKALTDLSGGHVMFAPKLATDADQYTLRIRSDSGGIWAYGPDDIQVGGEKSAVYLEWTDPRGSAVLTAIGHGMRLTVEIVVAGKIEQSDTFDPSNTTERDKLVAYARHLVETRDSRVCKPI